jgi:hypothetical protein
VTGVPYVRNVLLMLGVLALYGCGGGGGGDEPAGSGAPTIDVTPLTYAGETAAAAISLDSAELFAREMYSSLVLVDVLADLPGDMPSGTVRVSQRQTGPLGGELLVEGTLTAGLGVLSYTFRGYRTADIVLDGVIRQERIAHRQESAPDERHVELLRLAIARSSGDQRATTEISGSIVRKVQSFNTASRDVLGNLVVRDASTGEMGWLRDLRIRWIAGTNDFGVGLLTDYSGRLYLGDRGYADVRTHGQLLQGEDPPYQPRRGGALVVSGDPATRALIVPISAEDYALVFEDDQNEAGWRAKRLPWRSLLEEDEERSTEGDRPPVPAAVTPPWVPSGMPAEVSALASADLDDDWLSYRWTLALAPVGSTATVGRAAAPLPEFVPDVQGNYLLTVEISDGLHVVHDSLEIVAVDGRTPDPLYMPTPVLTRPPDTMTGELIEIDAAATRFQRHPSALSYAWTVTGPDGFSVDLGTSTDGRLEYAPGRRGVYSFVANVCNGSGDCRSRERTVAVDSALRTFLPSRLTFGRAPAEVVPANIDGNGRIDLVVTSGPSTLGTPQPDQVNVLRMRPDGGFDQFGWPAENPRHLAVGDLDGDGRDEVAVLAQSSLQVARIGVTGDVAIENFPVPPCLLPPTGRYQSVFMVDLDGDGRLDLAYANRCTGLIYRWLQDADGALVSGTSVPGPVGSADVTIRDLDGDGRADLVVSRSPVSPVESRGIVSVRLAQPNGSYAIVHERPIGDSNAVSKLAVGDLNGDGLEDIAAAPPSPLTNSAWVSYQASPGVFGEFVPIPLGEGRSWPTPTASIRVVDVDGDGRSDLYVAWAGFLLQQADGTLAPPTSAAGLADSWGQVADDWQIADLSADGRPDLIHASPSGSTIYPWWLGGLDVRLARPPDRLVID